MKRSQSLTDGGYAQLGIVVLGILLWPLLFIAVPPTPAEPEAPALSPSGTRHHVVSVTDGDTIVIDINGEREAVRVIGIDAPEVYEGEEPECFAVAAQMRARELLLGKNVRLESDPSQDERDAYGRLLGYVTTENREDFSLRMIEDGYAREYTHITPYERQEAFQLAEQEARAAEKGLWGACEEEL